jgi:hypothetical protein
MHVCDVFPNQKSMTASIAFYGNRCPFFEWKAFPNLTVSALILSIEA